MRATSFVLTGAAMLAVVAVAGRPSPQTCMLTIELHDADSGKSVPGLVHLEDNRGATVPLEGLLQRGLGVNDSGATIHRWSVLPARTMLKVPADTLTLEAFQGLETELARVALDLRGKAAFEAHVSLKRFYRADQRGFRSANTHLHLMKLDRSTADRYLREVPAADGLDVVFLSYLERAVEDRDYISNRYSKRDVEALSGAGVLFGNGEEHRHNYGPGGEGYGHVMLLDLEQLVQPVSIGPGIMRRGTDGIPIQRGIDSARGDGATAVWCHNDWGMEDVPNWVTGRLDAQNIFDGGSHGSYKHSFYRYLNAGMRVPFSTGTDWFMYDLSRVYAQSAVPISVQRWLRALAEGKSYITNGPLLEFSLAGRSLGATIGLSDPDSVPARGRALGRVDFGRIELVRNGKVIATAKSRPVDGHFVAEMDVPVEIAGPAWLALRTPPPPVAGDEELQAAVPTNELGRELFSHTSAIYVEVSGKPVFFPEVAEALLAEMEENRALIAQKSLFDGDAERATVLKVHDEAMARLRDRLRTVHDEEGSSR